MHSLISIVNVVLSGKENYWEWYRKIKTTLIFNDPWNGVCEETPTSEEEDESKANSKSTRPTIPTSNKECAIWKDKD
jgi:hypothetical protein